MTKHLSDDQGFTLIELLVVILIIGILAAIALPNFLGQRSRGQDAAAKSNARNMVSHVEACYTDTQNYGDCTTQAQLGSNLGIELGSAAEQALVTGAGNTFNIAVRSKSGGTFTIAKTATGAIARTCTPAGNGACPANGQW